MCYVECEMICSDAWDIILQYTSPYGNWKYTCKTFFNAAMNTFNALSLRGDDVFSDSIIIGKRFPINSKKLKHSMKTTRTDCRYIAMAKQRGINKDLIVGSIVSNRWISNACKKYVLMNIVGKGYGKKYYIKRLVQRLYGMDDYDMLKFILFKFYPVDLLGLIDRCNGLGMRLVDDNVITPREYFGKIIASYSEHRDMKELLEKYLYKILREDDTYYEVNRFMWELERYLPDIIFIPKGRIISHVITWYYTYNRNKLIILLGRLN